MWCPRDPIWPLAYLSTSLKERFSRSPSQSPQNSDDKFEDCKSKQQRCWFSQVCYEYYGITWGRRLRSKLRVRAHRSENLGLRVRMYEKVWRFLMGDLSVAWYLSGLGLWTSVWKIHLNVLFLLSNAPRMTMSFITFGDLAAQSSWLPLSTEPS